ncbi:hypothetical protein GOBAR_AA15822 [Gossypium barbadense]|uniref:Uncharacterized protein n=1 Tax=Gossypium barbadense TaxID=3634 RepID=A0A2P5XNE5_GOSBA|nr:hypothetical protein GOBAR_AA15822 [Gossypium barbadense]
MWWVTCWSAKAIFESEMSFGCRLWMLVVGDIFDLEGELSDGVFSGQIYISRWQVVVASSCSLLGVRSSRCCCSYRTCMRSWERQ